jgi:hypothetical protein
MKVIQIVIDEMPTKCDECIMCIFDAEHMADWCYAMDRHALADGRPNYCPLEVEVVAHSRSEARRMNMMQNDVRYKYPPAEEAKHE